MCKKLMLLLFGILVLGLAGNASGALPAGWSNQDIGTTDPGSADVVGGVWSVTGNGSDIWGNSDNCHMVYTQFSGNCEVTALVTSVGDGTNNWAKGGVMIRENLTGGSVNSCVMCTPSNGGGLTFQIRPTADAASTSQHTQAPNVTPPHWVKIRRIGDTFTAWRSLDGVTWDQQGTEQTVVMAEDVYVGIVVTSHQDGELRTFTFENVTAEPVKFATVPDPADGEVVTDLWANLQWDAGGTAASHDVYFSESYDAVASGTALLGNQTDNWLLIGTGSGPYPDPLELGKTYYWRVDEVEADGVTKHPGNIWSFSLPAAIAGNPGPADGVRFVDVDVDLTWAAGYGAILHFV